MKTRAISSPSRAASSTTPSAASSVASSAASSSRSRASRRSAAAGTSAALGRTNAALRRAAPSLADVLSPGAAAAGEAALHESDATARIGAAIANAIVEQRLAPGAKLTEQKLADVFGVSRTIVRQALSRLARDKLVVLEAFKGACVARPSVEEARQVFAARRLIEVGMVQDAAQRLNAEHIRVLKRHHAAERAALARTDVPGRTRLLGDFHALLAELSGNQVLAEILTELASRTAVVSMLYQSSRSAQCSSDEHGALIEALARHDAKACARLMREHLDNVEQSLRLSPRTGDLEQVLLSHFEPLPATTSKAASKATATAATMTRAATPRKRNTNANSTTQRSAKTHA